MEGRQIARRVPVKRAAIGASHEVYPSAEAASRATVARCVADRIALEAEARRCARGGRRRVVVTTPILRSIDGGLDDLKFLYPVLDNIPLIVFPILSYALAGVQVSVYGSREVGCVVGAVRSRLLADGLIEDRDRILFVEEDRSEVSLMQSFRRSTAPFAASPEEVIVWSAGDLVLAYNTYPKLMDRHASTHEIIFDLNARQVVFPGGTTELFPRNYFDSLRLDGEGGRVVDVKEPNVILFTAAGMGGLAELDKLRRPRSGQTYIGVLLRAVLKASQDASPAATLAFLRYSFRRTRGALRPADALAQRHAVALASAVFGVPTMVKAENADPFLVKDCDSFEDLFGYYRALLQSIVDSGVTRADGFHELARYYPYADVLHRLSRDLLALREEIPLWQRWPEVVSDKIATLNGMLRTELAAAGLASSVGLVPEYFDARGIYRSAPTPTDDFHATKDLLRGRYRAAFAADRATYLSLAGGGNPPSRTIGWRGERVSPRVDNQ
jgi:hypothetical protein